jgi:hypothetical protein
MAWIRVLLDQRSASNADRWKRFKAQLYDDYNDVRPVWTCSHNHTTALEAQLCGVRHLSDQLEDGGRRRPEVA